MTQFKNIVSQTIILSLFFFVVLIQAAESSKAKVFNKDYSGIQKITAEIKTHEGLMELELYFKESPNTVANFIDLANKGFYNGLIFHRVIQGFMIQGGDPDGNGTGGPGYSIDDEYNDLKHEVGSLAMANSGANTGGSQFYITHMPQTHLDNRHTIFGKLTDGFDVLTRIEKGDVIQSIKITEVR